MQFYSIHACVWCLKSWKNHRPHTHTNAHSQKSHKKVDEKHPFVQRRAVSCCFNSSDNWGKLVFYSCANQQLSQLFTRRNDGEKFLWKKTTTGFDANKKMYFRRLASSCFLHSHFSFVSTFFFFVPFPFICCIIFSCVSFPCASLASLYV